MKNKYQHWSDPDIYVQMRNETGSTDRLRKFFHLTHLNEKKKTVLIPRKTINLIIPSSSYLYNIDFWISCALLYSESKSKQHYIENTIKLPFL